MNNYYHLKGTIIHWIEGAEYRRFDIGSNTELERIRMPVESHLVSVSDEEIEIVDMLCDPMITVYRISLHDMKIIDHKELYCPANLQHISLKNLGTLSLQSIPYQCSKVSGPIEIIPLSRHKCPIRIEEQEGYLFEDLFYSNGNHISLWSKNGTYHLLDQEDMKDTKIPIVEPYSKFILLNGNLVVLSTMGIWINGRRVETGNWLNVTSIGEGYIIKHQNRRIYRITEYSLCLLDIKVRHMTNVH